MEKTSDQVESSINGSSSKNDEQKLPKNSDEVESSFDESSSKNDEKKIAESEVESSSKTDVQKREKSSDKVETSIRSKKKVETSINGASSKNDEQKIANSEVESSINGGSSSKNHELPYSEDDDLIINGRSKAKARLSNVENKEPYDISKKYLPIKMIGQGTFGVVCSALNTKTNELVAIKKIRIIFLKGKTNALQILREIRILKHLWKHDFIVQLKDIMIPSRSKKLMDFEYIYLVFEYMELDLYQAIQEGIKLTDEDYQHLLAQLLLGLKSIHSSAILHRDLKLGNVLIDTSRNLKICDFGLSRAMKTTRRTNEDELQPMTNNVATLYYKAPELALGCTHYSTPVDIWSVGCIFAELIQRRPLFPGLSDDNLIDEIIGYLGTPDPDELDFIDNVKGRDRMRISAEEKPEPAISFSRIFSHFDQLGIELLGKMLAFHPGKRINVDEALEHGYIQEKVEELREQFDLDEPIKEIVYNMEDEVDIDEERIKNLLWVEMMSFHCARNPNYGDNEAQDEDDDTEEKVDDTAEEEDAGNVGDDEKDEEKNEDEDEDGDDFFASP